MKDFGKVFSKDRVGIAYEHQRNGFGELVIVCPGFFNSKANRWMQKAGELVAKNYDVLMFDFRGHGESEGKFLWSAREHWDLEAILEYALQQGYQKIGALGFSLGAAAAVNLLSYRREISSAVLVSCPASFWKIDYHFWQRGMFLDLLDNIECDWEGKGARTGFLFLPKPSPVKSVTKIEHAALFLVHGDEDWIVKAHHAKRLYASAVAPVKRCEIIEHGFHAERLIQQYPERMEALILDWFNTTLKGAQP